MKVMSKSYASLRLDWPEQNRITDLLIITFISASPVRVVPLRLHQRRVVARGAALHPGAVEEPGGAGRRHQRHGRRPIWVGLGCGNGVGFVVKCVGIHIES